MNKNIPFTFIIDSFYKGDSIVISVSCRQKPELRKAITVYIKKKINAELLPTTDELLNRWKKEGRRNKNGD